MNLIWIRARALLVALLAVAVVATACGDDGENSSEPQTSGGDSSAEPTAGGELTIAQQSLAATLDPAKMIATQAAGQGTEGFAIFGALMIADNETLEMEPLLAESLESADNGTTWTLKLRPDLEFTDGTPFDAEAVKFNWDRIADAANASPARAGILAEIASYNVVDAVTLEIKLNRQNTMFPRLFTSALTFIGSPTALQAGIEAFSTKPVGAGPFVVESFTQDSRLELTRNPSYFDAPRPYIDKLIFTVNADEDQRYRSVNAGEADVMAATARAKEEAARSDGLGVLPTSQTMVGFLSFNTTREPTDDLRVRSAFAIVADTAALCQARNTGVACPEPLPTALFPSDSPFYEPDQDLPQGELADAQALVDEYLEEKGIDSLDVTITVVSNPDQINIATIFQANLSQLDNVNVELETLELTTFLTKVRGAEHQISAGSFSGTYPYPSIKEYFTAGGVRNGSFGAPYSSPEIDAAIVDIESTPDLDEQGEGFKVIARQIAKDVPLIPTIAAVFMQIYQEDVQGVATWSDNILRTDLVWLDD